MLEAAFCSVALLHAFPLPQDIARGAPRVDYTVSATDAQGEEGRIPLRVQMRIPHPPRGRTVLQMPVWAPGSYRLRDFPDRVHGVTARLDDGQPADVLRLNRHTFEVRTGDAHELRIGYRVDLTPNDRFMMRGPNRRCITYEGPGVYMYVRGRKHAPCVVRFDIPDGWEAMSGLVDRGDGSWFAQDYDFLADCPVKLGVFQRFRFESHGKLFDVIVDGPGDIEFDHETWLANIEKITDCQGDMFRGEFPFDRYTFLFTASPRGSGGGLEHLTSTAIGLSSSGLRRDPSVGMGIIAHEFFHLWNVKRIRAIELGPFDYTRPNRTTALWLMEGVTSYYTSVTLARCGFRSEEAFWQGAIDQIRSLENAPAREHVSSAMASYRVWDPKPRDRSLNYYTSGAVLGLLLDLEIRAATQNRRSLDDVMRALYDRCRSAGRGFEEHELVDLVGSIGGRDFGGWFDRYVSGTLIPPYESILAHAGVRATTERSRRSTIRGLTWLTSVEGGRRLYYEDPAASGFGRLRTGQGRVARIDGQSVGTPDELAALLATCSAGDTIRCELVRPAGDSAEVTLVVTSEPVFDIDHAVDPDPGQLALAIRNGITGSDSVR